MSGAGGGWVCLNYIHLKQLAQPLSLQDCRFADKGVPCVALFLLTVPVYIVTRLEMCGALPQVPEEGPTMSSSPSRNIANGARSESTSIERLNRSLWSEGPTASAGASRSRDRTSPNASFLSCSLGRYWPMCMFSEHTQIFMKKS